MAGTAYPATQLAAAGGTGALTWSALSPLPAGLSLSPAGQITGTPAAPGPGSFTAQVTDSAAPPQLASAQFSLSVLGITTSALPDGAVGAAYPATQLVSTGGTGALTWASNGALPDGLTLSQAGLITGTPASVGQATFTVTVTDGATPARTASATLAIDVAQLAVPAISLPEGAVGVSYPATQLTATGGTGALSWTSSGTLPSGLSLSATGVLAGTPTTAGQATFTVTATDSATPAKTASVELSVSILGITTAALPQGSVGAPYSQTLVSTGGTGTLTWGSRGALPAGLSLSASGAISGTPTVAGPAGFTVRVTDRATPRQRTARQFTLSVLGVTTATLPEGAVGTTYPASQLAAAGGTGALTWTGSGALPPGLSLSATGLITGIPTAAGPATFTVTVTDTATQQQASTPLTIDVAAEPVEVPQVHGRPDSARDKLLSLGLVVADQMLEAISDKPSGTVVGSYPPAGSLVPPGHQHPARGQQHGGGPVGHRILRTGCRRRAERGRLRRVHHHRGRRRRVPGGAAPIT